MNHSGKKIKFVFIWIFVLFTQVLVGYSQGSLVAASIQNAGYLGASGDDLGNKIALDQLGNVYVLCNTNSAGFPITSGAFDNTYNGGSFDVCIVKFNFSLDNILAATFLGGSGSDMGYGIAISDSGYLYISGITNSSDFPLTQGAFKDSLTSSNEIFVVKMDANLTSIVSSTLVAPSLQDVTYGKAMIALDIQGNVFVTGNVDDTIQSLTSSGFDNTFNGHTDAVIYKLTNGLNSMLAYTYIGDSVDDYVMGITTNSAGQVFVTGRTNSPLFPTTSGAITDTLTGSSDLFICRLNNDLSQLEASTFFGGSGFDLPLDIQLDKNEKPVIAGQTYSGDWPLTSIAYRYTLAGVSDGFVIRTSADLTTLEASTYIGGSNVDQVQSLAVDNQNEVYLAGFTLSPDFPVDTLNGIDTSFSLGNFEGFLSKFNEGLWVLTESTWFGGSTADQVTSIALNPTGDLYFTGWTNSNDLPVTPSSFDTIYKGAGDAFVATVMLTATGISKNPTLKLANTYFLNDNNLEFTITETAELSVSIFSIDGKLIGSILFGNHSPGVYQYVLPTLKPGIYILGIRINGEYYGEKLGVF